MSYSTPLVPIKSMTEDLKIPTRSTELAGGYDIYLPEDVTLYGVIETVVSLGFAMEVPPGHVALLLPRSSAGNINLGVGLSNTCGVIDADYRGEWKAKLKLNAGTGKKKYLKDDRLVQFIIVPVLTPELTLVDELTSTIRGEGGFGSTGQ